MKHTPDPFVGLALVFLVLAVLKLLGGLEWDWATILTPLWVLAGIIVGVVVLWVLSPFVAAVFTRREK